MKMFTLQVAIILFGLVLVTGVHAEVPVDVARATFAVQ